MEPKFTANLPHKVYRAEQVRHNESLIAGALGIEMFSLMVAAGEAMFDCIVSACATRHIASRTMTVLCGYGNNGGDGYVVARLAKAAGWQVTLIQVGNSGQLSPDASTAQQQWFEVGGQVVFIDQTKTVTEPLPTVVDQPKTVVEQLKASLAADTVVVDALLGSGLKGPVRGPFDQLIDWINQTPHALVCAVDIPSGLHGDTGQALGCAVLADICCTFVALKQGLFTGLGGDYRGQVYFAGLGISTLFAERVKASAICSTLTTLKSQIQQRLPARATSSHKGRFGHVILIGSNRGMPGAIRMAAMACLRVGAGLVSVLTHQDNVATIAGACAELMVNAVGEDEDISRWLAIADVIVFGPGIGQDQWSRDLLVQVLRSDKAKVIDADGLNLLAKSPQPLSRCVITPHPKEAARLLKIKVAEVEKDRFATVTALANQYDTIALLKGFGTLVSDGDGPKAAGDGDDKPLVKRKCHGIRLNTTGNPGMATAGMGDILAGVIGGLIAQGVPLYEAAALGACLHGAAGDRAAVDGQRGMMATDLYCHIRALINNL